MSKVVSSEDIRNLRIISQNLAKLEDESNLLEKRIADDKSRLVELYAKRTENRIAILNLLDEIDCSNTKNMGGEYRIPWMFSEIARQNRDERANG